ncbi:UNVERIFIED_CONTAM: sugar phosphate isomerase/epimerase [Kocuria sp. CPCC 205316]|uniref:sugar phosphate isomerase/epimerase family protein n=1 Tax=Kocuria TaxID=57493 RepID=UPI0036DB87FA
MAQQNPTTTTADAAAQQKNPVLIGTAPDSWGVWFADDPRQTPWERFLDEVAEAGYSWIELGPYGYLPTDPARLADELAQRNLQVSAGTVFTAFHRGADQWREAWEPARKVAELTAAMGGEHIVVIPAMWRDDVTGEALENEHLSTEQWNALCAGHDRLGKVLREEYGLQQQFHSHADSHVCGQPDIETFLQRTDPELVTLCLDTGHAEYGGASSADLIRKYPERIGYLHLKQIDPVIMERVRRENLTWAAANLAGVMVEPPAGLPDLAEVITEVEKLDRPIFGIVEQDMYPVSSFDVPLPIATRTRSYLLGCGSRTRVR